MEDFPLGPESPGTGYSLDQEQDRIARSEVRFVHFLKHSPKSWVRGPGLPNREHTNRYLGSMPTGHEESPVFGSFSLTERPILAKSRDPI